MDFLLNPDIAYILLVAGTFLMLLAFVTPGSGFAEVGAFFCLVLAGYAIYHLSVNGWALGVLALSLVPFVVAVQKPGREAWLIVSILGFIIGSVFFFPTGQGLPSVDPILAIVTSVIYAVAVWFIVRKVVASARRKPIYDLSTLLDQRGETKTPVEGHGTVHVAGELWSARSAKLIPTGSAVRVVGREGFVLIVENEISS